MFKVGKVINYLEKIGITLVEVSGILSVGDTIKVYQDGEEILVQKIDRILINQKPVDMANPKDVIALQLNGKVQKNSEVYRLSQLGTSSRY
jgi:sulfate adenylyltransferase subunit 1 (EFTu-like GTPase family)